MGGGEVARYIGKYGSKDVTKAVIIGGVPPYLLKTKDNPEGVDGSVFEGIQKAVAADRYAFFTEFFKNFYNTDVHDGKARQRAGRTGQLECRVPSRQQRRSFACVPTWHEDFRGDLAKVDVPTLVIHGDSDRIVPFSAAGQRTAKLVKGAELVTIQGGPHNVAWTHSEEVNRALLQFLAKPSAKTGSAERAEAVA